MTCNLSGSHFAVAEYYWLIYGRNYIALLPKNMVSSGIKNSKVVIKSKFTKIFEI